jgi:protein SCO1/2
MTRMRALLALVLSCAACRHNADSLPFYRNAAMTPEWLSRAEATAPTMHRVAEFRMVDQGGRTVTERSLAGHVTLVHFFFTACGDVCPLTTSNLGRVLAGLPGDDRLQLLSYSVTPERDSVGALRAFAAMHGIADPRWHLLTGSRSDVERLARDSYFVRLGDGRTYGVQAIAHTESVLLVDADGRLRGVYAGTLPLEMERLRQDIAELER